MQLLIGVLLYKEPFDGAQLVGFGLVWAALVLFAVEGYVRPRWPAVDGVTDVERYRHLLTTQIQSFRRKRWIRRERR